MHEILNQTLPLVIAVFLSTAMFSLGLDLTTRQIIDPLRDRRLVAISLLANVVLVPLAALGIAGVIPMDAGLRTGFLLYAFAAGVESGPKLVQLAKGNAAFAVGLLAIQIVITVVFLPVVITLVNPDAHVSRANVLFKLLLVVVLPIAIGLYIKARRDALAIRLSPVMHRIAVFLLAVVFAQLIYIHFDALLAVPSAALLAALLLFAIAFAIGYVLGGPKTENRRALAIMTFARNASISMMIAGQVFTQEPEVLVMITVLTVLAIVLAVPAIVSFRRTTPTHEAAQSLPT